MCSRRGCGRGTPWKSPKDFSTESPSHNRLVGAMSGVSSERDQIRVSDLIHGLQPGAKDELPSHLTAPGFHSPLKGS